MKIVDGCDSYVPNVPVLSIDMLDLCKRTRSSSWLVVPSIAEHLSQRSTVASGFFCVSAACNCVSMMSPKALSPWPELLEEHRSEM